MPLTAIKLKQAKPKNKMYKLYDSHGLYLIVNPTGKRSWRIKYTLFGKEKSFTLGEYPKIGLSDARLLRDQYLDQISEGLDPSIKSKMNKLNKGLSSESSFQSIANEWIEVKGNAWTHKYRHDIKTRLENHLFPILGSKPINRIQPADLLYTVRKLENEDKLEMARRALQMAGQVFRYAVAIGVGERDVSQDLKGALKTRKVKHNPILMESELPDFLKALSRYDGHILTKYAIELLLLTMLRTIELRGGKWSEVDFQSKKWSIPAGRMKMSRDHIVPLSSRAIEILKEVKSLGMSDQLIFPNQNKPNDMMSSNTILFALYRMGYHSRLTAHGFRGTASTILNENGFNSDWIEKQLAHSEANSVRAAYNHADYLNERRKMMEWWARFVENSQTAKSHYQ